MFRWRRGRVVLLVTLVVLLTLAGRYLWVQTWFGGRVETLSGTPYTLRVQDGVSRSEVDLVETALEEADQYASDVLGGGVKEPVEVRLALRSPCVPFHLFGSSPTAVAQRGSLCVDTDSPGWTAGGADPTLAGSIVAHEHYHVLQAELGCLPGPDEHTHAWQVEGAATWVGWQTEVVAGHATQDEVKQAMRDWGGWDRGIPPLAELEQQISGDAEYALAFRAVDRLVARTGPRSLISFCELVAANGKWRDAFEKAFGIPVDTFYAEFERTR